LSGLGSGHPSEEVRMGRTGLSPAQLVLTNGERQTGSV
jgi:hypothetical protein